MNEGVIVELLQERLCSCCGATLHISRIAHAIQRRFICSLAHFSLLLFGRQKLESCATMIPPLSTNTSALLARLPPMKRILAMATTTPSRVLGFAVSDPYLAYATPLPSTHLDSHIFQKETPVGQKGVLPKHAAKRGATGNLPKEEIIPTNPLQLLEQLECTDVGAIRLLAGKNNMIHQTKRIASRWP